MRTGLIVLGVIFLVIGILLFLAPLQEFKVETEKTGDGNDTDVETSYARISVPVSWAIASVIIGLVLLIFGLVIPGPIPRRALKGEHGHVVETREVVKDGDGNKKRIVKERAERHRTE